MFGLNAFGRIGAVVRSAFGFSPASLFASGEQGAWYDPSDLTTMFQDSVGSVPVTADGQPVGLILDKSKGLVLGPELSSNTGPNFTNSTGYYTAAATITVSSGKLVVTGTATGANIIGTTLTGIPVGAYLEFTVHVNNISADGNVKLGMYDDPPGSNPCLNFYNLPSGVRTTFRVKATNADGTVAASLIIIPLIIGEVFEVVEFSIKVVSGNHASQATAAARPLYKTAGGLHWLQFDGVDDSLSTAEIDFTATDKTTAFTGTLKSAVSLGAVFKTGAVDNTAGSFGYAQDYHSSSNPSAWLFGTSDGSEIFNITYPIGSGYVSTIKYDIGAAADSELVFRGNGVGYSSNFVGDAGTGNFGNNILYVGIRGGVYPINGNIYSLIVLGRLATTQEITDTETWVNSKTGAY